MKPRGIDDGLACTEITKAGHPLPCSSGMCNSKLRALRAASVHYPALRKLLHSVYMARKCHNTVENIDSALSTFDYKVLCDLMHINEYENLIREHLDEEKNCDTSDDIEFIAEGLANVEEKLEIKFASIFEEYKNKLKDDFEYPCSSCERLHTRSSVTQYTANTEKFSSDQWRQLKQYLKERDEIFDNKIYYICAHCRPLLNETNFQLGVFLTAYT